MINRRAGFTIVELLIVIVVIAILAAITIVAYNGIQSRATDARMRSAANQVEKAIRRYHIETGKQPHAGWTSLGGSARPVTDGSCPDSTYASGWLGGGAYPCTIEDLLTSGGYIQNGYILSLPPNKNYSSGTTNGRLSLMFYQCGSASDNRFGLYWYLSDPNSEDTAQMSATLAGCGNGIGIRDTYGTRSGKIIQL